MATASDYKNRARFALKSATETWPNNAKNQVKNLGPLFDKWAKIQLGMEKSLTQLTELDKQLNETLTAVKHTLDAGTKIAAYDKDGDHQKLWTLMRKLLTEMHRHFCDANADKMAALHVTKQPMKLD